MLFTKHLPSFAWKCLVAFAAITWTGCQKEEITTTVPSDASDLVGSVKAPNYLFSLNPTYASLHTLQVHIGSDASAGSSLAPANGLIALGTTGTTIVYTEGKTVQCGSVLDASKCNFVVGTTYNIVPAGTGWGSPKILRLRFTSNSVPNTGSPWFTYNKTLNTWTAQAGATNFSVYSFLNSMNWISC